MNWTTMRNGILAVAMVVAVGAQAQTTNAWVPTSGTADWNTAGNWDPASVPNAATHVAIFTNDYLAHVTNTLSADVVLNGLFYNDAGAVDNTTLVILGKQITFAGTAPYIRTASDYAGRLLIYSTVVVSGVTLTVGGQNPYFMGPFVGDGTLFVNSGSRNEFHGINSNFTGSIIVSNNVELQGRTSDRYWSFGDTNGATSVYGTSVVNPMRDAIGMSNAEPFHVYGVNAAGSVQFFATTNSRYQGVMSLHTNGTMSISQWDDPSALRRKDFFFNGTIQDDGNNRDMHFLSVITSQGTGLVSRTSQIVFGGQGTYGGFTHIGNTRAPDLMGDYDGYLQLTNGNNRLPAGTTMFLGGTTNSGALAIGARGASGILILAGANQEFAGLYRLGTGVNNRVIGGTPTNNTLTLNTVGGTTNLYGGYLGGAGVNENNLALTKKGTGFLDLTNLNTFTGPTTVEAGTLRIGGVHVGATTVKTNGTLNVDGTHTLGLITVENGGTLGGTGTVGAITSAGTVSPGNSPGTLTASGNVTLGAGATLLLELNEIIGDDYDKLVMTGGAGSNALNLTGSPNLTLNLNFTPGMGDMFTIVSGFAAFDPGFDGTFSGKPDLGTFDVSGTTFQIDYTPSDITVTVVPEPQTLGLLGLAALGGLLRRRIRR